MLTWTGFARSNSAPFAACSKRCCRVLCPAPWRNAAVEGEEISEEEKHAVARSKAWFKNNQGTSLGGVAAELGFSMDEIRNGTAPA
jgi:hypothetical protein